MILAAKNRSGWLISFLAAIGFALLLVGPFRAGWNTATTDFPNYYTAAVLTGEHKSLRDFYDWTWFQRQMDYAGVQRQLGAYTPQTPLTMAPFIPFAGAKLQTAKRVWLAFNLVFLFAIVLMLRELSGLSFASIALLTMCGYGSLAANFAIGQYYVFLLLLLTATYWLLNRQCATASGWMAGFTFGLKLYSGPLVLFFAARKRWNAVLGMGLGVISAVLITAWMFGWADLYQYAAHVLGRTLEGGSIDPFNPGNPTMATLLRRMLMRDAQLNPHPAFEAPALFFFLLSAFQLGVPVVTALGVAHYGNSAMCRDFAWFVIASMLLSTSVGGYSFILLLLPVALILKDCRRWEAVLVAAVYMLLTASLAAQWWFPKVLLLLLLYFVVGRARIGCIPARWWGVAASAVLTLSFASAMVHMRNYDAEPGRRYTALPAAPGSLFSSYPTIVPAGLFFQCMDRDRYKLCWSHDGRVEPLTFDGDAFTPRVAGNGGAISFELVRNGSSRFLQFDPARRAVSELDEAIDVRESVVSPDGRWWAESIGPVGVRQIWLVDAASGHRSRLAGGNCDSAHPVWDLDSSAVIFASDCGRAYGLPVLYRADVR